MPKHTRVQCLSLDPTTPFPESIGHRSWKGRLSKKTGKYEWKILEKGKFCYQIRHDTLLLADLSTP